MYLDILPPEKHVQVEVLNVDAVPKVWRATRRQTTHTDVPSARSLDLMGEIPKSPRPLAQG